MSDPSRPFPEGPEIRHYTGRGYGALGCLAPILLFCTLILIPGVGLPIAALAALGAASFGLRGMTTRLNATIRPPSPRSSAPGRPIRLVDPSDGRPAFEDALAMASPLLLLAYMAGLIALAFVAALVIGLYPSIAHGVRLPALTSVRTLEAMLSPFFLFMLAWVAATALLLGFSWLIVRRRWRVMRRSGPGLFDVPAWPLRPGDEVRVTFRRRLSPGLSLNRCEGYLELVWVLGGAPGSHRIWTLSSEPLGDGKSTRTKQGVAAAWRLTVPSPPARDEVAARFGGLPALGYPLWRLRIALDVTDLPDRDSELLLALSE